MNGTISDIAGFPKFRNGDVDSLVVPARASSLSAEFNYPFIDGLNQDNAKQYIGAFVALEYAKLGTARHGAQIEGGHDPTEAGNLASFGQYIARAKADTSLRMQALVIGCARSAFLIAWNIRPEDITGAERDNPNLARLQDDAITLTSGHTDGAADLTLTEALMLSWTEMTEVEQGFGFAIMTMALGALPASGIQLLKTGHHYLSNDRKFTMVIEKQVLNLATPEVQAKWSASSAEVRDWLWHKSCHAVSSVICKRAALDPRTVDKLNTVKLGSASVRLPFKEDSVRRAEAFAAIVAAVKITMSQMASSVKIDKLLIELEAVKAAPHDADITGVAWVAPASHPDATSRKDMITRNLIPAIERARTSVAFAAGVYSGILSRSDNGPDSRMNAHSVTKLVRDEVSAFNIGLALYQSYVRYSRTAAENGEFCPMIVSDSAAGNALGNVPADVVAVAAAPAAPAAPAALL